MNHYIFPGLPESEQKKFYAQTISLNKILKAVCQYFNVSELELKKKSRRYKYLYPRQIFYYISRKTTKHSLKQIALVFDQDHATVISSIVRISDDLVFYPRVQNDVKTILNLINLSDEN